MAINSVVAELVDGRARRRPGPRWSRSTRTPSTCSAGSGTSGSAPGSGWPPSPSARSPTRLPRLSAADRAAYVAEVERLHGEGHTVLDKYTDPSGSLGSRGPGLGEAARRRDAAGPLARRRRRAAAGGAGRGLARGRAAVRRLRPRPRARHRPRRPGRASCAPPATPPAARELGDQAREVAHRLGAQPLLDRLRAQGSTAGAAATVRPPTRSPRARPRSSRWWPRAAPTARSASSCSSAPRPSRSTSPTSSASSAPPAAPRPPRSRAGRGAARLTPLGRACVSDGPDGPGGYFTVLTPTHPWRTMSRRPARRRRHDHHAPATASGDVRRR